VKLKSRIRLANSGMEYIEIVDRAAYPSIIESAQEIRFTNKGPYIVGFGRVGFAVSSSLPNWIIES
jgi:hypothetical protein